MSVQIPPQRGWKVVLGGALAALPASAPFVWAGSLGVHGVQEGSDAAQAAAAGWPMVSAAALPSPAALLAGTLLLLPFALSTMRVWRRG